MSENAWRSLVAESSRRSISSLRNFKDYISQRDLKDQLNGVRGSVKQDSRQGWREWAGDKIKYGRSQGSGSPRRSDERVSLFPGWAVRRYRNTLNQNSPEAFEVDIFISGFAVSQRTPENASRAQRAFMRLAKSFASLPKLVADVADPESGPSTPLSRSTEDLLASVKLPPRPTEITEDYEVRCLERQLQQASRQDSVDSMSSDPRSNVAAQPLLSDPETVPQAVAADLRKLHENLERRLRPFWSSSLVGRTVCLSLYAAPGQESVDGYGPLARQEFITTADGSFQGHITVKWEDLCQHPQGLHIAFGDAGMEHDLLLLAEVLPAPPSPSSSSDESSPTDPRAPYPIYKANVMKLPAAPDLPRPTAETKIRVPVTHSPIRVISDIDDTVKLSNILSGARAVFHNVFVKDYRDILIPGMGEWYTSMWSKGVRFHYVSNGPFELLPVVLDFLQASQLPPGSIRLKSYAGRSLFNGLLSDPASRKRAGIQDILDAFPQSRFMLVGDSGEQDLELYSEFAKERPKQILAVFIRYAEDNAEMIADPTGWKAIGTSSMSSMLDTNPLAVTPDQRDSSTPTMEQPTPRRSPSDVLANVTPKPKSLSLSIPMLSRSPSPTSTKPPSVNSEASGYFTPSPLTTEPERDSPSNNIGNIGKTPLSAKAPSEWSNYKHAINPSVHPATSSSSSLPPPRRPSSLTSGSSVSSAYLRMSEPDKKKLDLQTRVYRARTQMPSHVPLRIFRNPEECIEAETILKREGL